MDIVIAANIELIIIVEIDNQPSAESLAIDLASLEHAINKELGRYVPGSSVVLLQP